MRKKADKTSKKVGKKKAKRPPPAPEGHHLMADTFNVIHCRIALNDGIMETGDWGLVREKLFQVIGVHGWENTLRILASCARLFAEMPTPLPPLSNYNKDALHAMASKLDTEANTTMRLVDREAAKGHHI